MAVPEPANAECFSQPHWRLIARGIDVESWFNDGQVSGTGGILLPKELKLPVGQRYYRFASSMSSREAQLGGGWWVTYESFRQISDFARTNQYSLSESARLHLALPYSWTRVDRLVSAILAVPLRAYAGRGGVAHSGGADARDKNTKWIPLQHREVTQLYIPGLFVKGRSEQLFTRAFPDPVVEYIHGNRRQI
jgi:hypothetical protein